MQDITTLVVDAEVACGTAAAVFWQHRHRKQLLLLFQVAVTAALLLKSVAASQSTHAFVPECPPGQVG